MSAAVVDDDVQTSTHVAPAEQPRLDATMAFEGRISHKPSASNEVDRNGQLHPVVIVELDHVGPARQRLKAHVPCDTPQAAEALADSLKRGEHVTVAGPLSQIRLFVGAATLTTHHQEDK